MSSYLVSFLIGLSVGVASYLLGYATRPRVRRTLLRRRTDRTSFVRLPRWFP